MKKGNQNRTIIHQRGNGKFSVVQLSEKLSLEG